MMIIFVSDQPSYTNIGCWKDDPERAIQILEGKYDTLDGDYKKRENAIEKCFQVAVKRGFKYFAVQNGGQCFASEDAGPRYSMYGKADTCRDGKGASWANDVYIINGKS